MDRNMPYHTKIMEKITEKTYMVGTGYILVLRYQNHANYGTTGDRDGIVHTPLPDICRTPIGNQFLKPLGRFQS
jgi:hypothetical protein